MQKMEAEELHSKAYIIFIYGLKFAGREPEINKYNAGWCNREAYFLGFKKP